MARIDRSADVKRRIRTQAARLFAERGFTATSIRGIAAAAEVDPTIVLRHFHSKVNLFLDTLSLPTEWGGLLSGPLDEIPTRMLSFLMEGEKASQDGPSIYAAMLRATKIDEVREKVRAGLDRIITEPLAKRLTGDDAAIRAHLFSCGIVGILTSEWVIGTPEREPEENAELVQHYAKALRTLLY